MGHSYNGAERRKHLRIFKSYSLFFYYKDSPEQKSDETFIKDISKGGIRFTTSQNVKSGTLLVFEIGIPYIAPKRLVLEGVVISSKEITPRLVYEIRAKFSSMQEEAFQVIDKIEKLNLKDQKAYGLH